MEYAWILTQEKQFSCPNLVRSRVCVFIQGAKTSKKHYFQLFETSPPERRHAFDLARVYRLKVFTSFKVLDSDISSSAS